MDPMAIQGMIGSINGGGLDRLMQGNPLKIAGKPEIPTEGEFGQILSDAIGRTQDRAPTTSFEMHASNSGPSFGQTLTESVDKVNTLMNESDQMIEDLATGRSANVHGTLIALQKADISFKMLLEVRSKVMKAYEEVMRMQV